MTAFKRSVFIAPLCSSQQYTAEKWLFLRCDE